MQETQHHTKTKILVIVPSLACGGLERNISILCNHIDTDRFDVTLAVIDNASPFYRISNPAIRVKDLQCKRVRQSLGRIRSLVRETKPQVVLCAANHLNLMIAIFRPLFPKNIPIIARESSVVSVNTERTPWPFFYNLLLRKFYHKLDMIVCQSEYMQHDLISHYRVPKEKTQIIRNAVQVPVEPASTGSQTGTARFISVGRLSEEKGFDRILRALAMLTIPYQYCIVGDGPEREKLKSLATELYIEKHVRFAGSMPDPFTAMHSPDLFLMGSHYEGFPNVLTEANSIGIPVIAFRAPGGIPEVVENGVNGLLVEGQEPKDMAAAIEKALQVPFDKSRIQTETQKRYDAVNTARAWEKLFISMA